MNYGVEEQLVPNQPPLGTQFKSYELTAASNYWTLDPFQYSITKFKYNKLYIYFASNKFRYR